MIMRSVNGSRRTWIHSLRSTARKRRKENPFTTASWPTAQQMDEHVFKLRRDLVPVQRRRPGDAWPVPAPPGPCRRCAAPSRTPPPPPRPASRAAGAPPYRGRAPVAVERHQPAAPRHLIRRALHHDPAVGQIDDAPAALRLVHVMGRHQDRQAVRRHVVDQVPELAARLGVDAGRRLVEQQQLRLVQDAGGQRQPLLPAARQLRRPTGPRGPPAPSGR